MNILVQWLLHLKSFILSCDSNIWSYCVQERNKTSEIVYV